MSKEKAKAIAALNDRFRLRFNIPFVMDEPIVPGQIVATRAVLAFATMSTCVISTPERFKTHSFD